MRDVECEIKSSQLITKLGTHDVSILDLSGGVFETLATSGDTHLGGSAIDEIIMNFIVDEFKKENGVDISTDSMAMQRVKEAAEKAKIELSASNTTEINLPYLFPVDNVPKHYVSTLTRAKFEQMIAPIIDRTIAPVKTALESANLGVDDIDEIILVGGSTRIPAVQKAVSDYFGGHDLNKSVNPDEVVAAGASVQGAVLGGDSTVNSDILLLDVTPLNLGIETLGGVMTTMIDANTTIPCKKSQTYSCAEDYQSAVTIHVLQGNRTKASDCKSLGNFSVDIVPQKKEQSKIEVTFDIDANGIIKVSAVDSATGKSRDITISGDSGLSKEEIERMKAEAEANAEADKKFMEDANKLNTLSSYAYSIKNSLEEDNIKNVVSEEQKKTITDKVAEIETAVKERDIEKAEALQKEINDIMEPIMKEIYEKQAAEQAAQQAANESANASTEQTTSDAKNDEPTAEDVPFEEVKD